MGFNYSWISWVSVLIIAGVIFLFILFPWLFIAVIKIVLAILRGIIAVITWIVTFILSLFGGKKAKGLRASQSKGKTRRFD